MDSSQQMKINELLCENIPTLNFGKFLQNTLDIYSKYPKNSITPREIVHTLNLGNMSIEEAQKITDALNGEVTNTILSFQDKLNKSKKN